jgi:hypothetical protein
MRLPIILMLAVIVFTPADIGEVARDAFGQAQAIVADYLGSNATIAVADLPADDETLLVASHADTANNTIGNIR